jgi:hypothetical protein
LFLIISIIFHTISFLSAGYLTSESFTDGKGPVVLTVVDAFESTCALKILKTNPLVLATFLNIFLLCIYSLVLYNNFHVLLNISFSIILVLILGGE